MVMNLLHFLGKEEVKGSIPFNGSENQTVRRKFQSQFWVRVGTNGYETWGLGTNGYEHGHDLLER